MEEGFSRKHRFGGSMVQLSRISKDYTGQIKVLDRVDLSLKKGEFVYVVGGSGAGKSSLLRILATEEAPSSGTASLFGYRLDQVSGSTLRAIRRSLGYVPQDIRLISDLTTFENVALSLSLASSFSSRNGIGALSSASRLKIDELLIKLGLDKKKDKLAHSLSGGESQRVAIARALVREPELIIADEPTGAQDRDFKWSVMDLFLKANARGATVVVATHDRDIVRRVRKKCALLRSGHITLEEPLCI